MRTEVNAQEERERIRRGLEVPSNVRDWEASCLKHVADLLDTLEQARGEWGSLSAQLTKARAKLEELREDRTRLRDEREKLKREREALRTECENLRADRDTLAALQGEHEVLRTERDRLSEEIETLRRAADEGGAREQELAGERDELLTRAERLEEEKRRAEKERDELARASEQAASAERVAEHEGEARYEVLRREHESLQKKVEEQTVLACDFRARVNRLEEQRDDAERNGRRKVKKILKRIHAALDELGAPAGEDVSFGERLRRFRRENGLL